MTDNTQIIRSLLSFNENDYYFLQIMKRRKDNPGLYKDMILIKNYYISSFDEFDRCSNEIKNICNSENARAYFRLNKRNYHNTGLQMLKRVASHIAGGNYRAMKSVFDSVSGDFHSDPDKKWVVDLDNFKYDDLDVNQELNNIIEFVTELQTKTGREPLMIYLPSKNGLHIVTRPFNLNKFKEKYNDIDLHKDNPVILYCP